VVLVCFLAAPTVLLGSRCLQLVVLALLLELQAAFLKLICLLQGARASLLVKPVALLGLLLQSLAALVSSLALLVLLLEQQYL
jgi:hypothetical protein